ncbi:Possible Zn-dependent peptidase [Prochlorococcus marinus str. MIT 9515]|uniref:Possible Zn-dependent peptidase n=1 Tax=Prochlorococcus marinus (strain MIT 9515) TaxID=167542 RepID=A2BW84_PROM5|nr:pitrilysin family protein [Prochlorococcus marinus]ABM72045.1 Possible Zn-dependent peptidase [Prochlorococcus marinus str. MIT 9515]
MNLGEINYYNHSSKPKCVFVENKELPLICIDFWFKAGSSFEESDKSGTAHLLEHMIFKGSNKIMPGEFDHRIESLGGISNASTGYDDAHYYVLVPKNNFKESLALLTNILRSPNFNINEFNKEKSVVIDEIKQQNDQPDEKLFNYFLGRVWIDNFYGKTILGTEKDVQSLAIDDLEKFHKKFYNIENSCISIAGNIAKVTFEECYGNNFSYLGEANSSQIISKNKLIAIPRTGREEIDFKNIEFSRIYMAWSIPSIKNQRINIGFEILTSILSVGRNSRLVKVLKEDKNLVESIYVDVNGGELGGLLVIEACCDNVNLLKTEEEINKIIKELVSSKNLTINELTKALNIVKSNYIFNLETSTQLTSFFGSEFLWGRKNSINDLDNHLRYWNNLNNFRKILHYLSKDKFTLIASAK